MQSFMKAFWFKVNFGIPDILFESGLFGLTGLACEVYDYALLFWRTIPENMVNILVDGVYLYIWICYAISILIRDLSPLCKSLMYDHPIPVSIFHSQCEWMDYIEIKSEKGE